MKPIVNDRVAWSVGLSVGLSPIAPMEKNSKAIEIIVCVQDWWAQGKTYYM